MIGELGKNVVIKYHAEVAAAQANVKSLAATQQKHAGAMKTQQEAEIAGLEGKIAKYAKYAMYAGAAFAAIKVSIDAMGYAYDQQELRERAAGHSIEALREATRGLVSENELLKLAQSANLGVMKTSAADLVILAKAMDVYKERGYDATKVAQDFGEYLQTGKAKALKDYGLQIDEARGSVAQYAQTMKQLSVVAKEQAKIEEDGGDRMQKRKIQVEDATAKLKESFGTMVAAAEPLLTFIVDTMTMILDGWREIIDLMNDLPSMAEAWRAAKMAMDKTGAEVAYDEAMKITTAMLQKEVDRMQALKQEQKQAAFDLMIANASPAEIEFAKAAAAKLGSAMSEGFGAGIDELSQRFQGGKKKKGGKGGIRIPVVFTTVDDVEIDIMRGRSEAKKAAEAATREAANLRGEFGKSSPLDVDGFQSSGFNAPELQTAIDAAGELQRIAAESYQSNESVLRKMFGDPQEIEIYAAGLKTLQDAGGQAFAAFITGSGNAGEAFKKMVAQNMIALSSEMFGRSLYEAAMAVGSLAMYDFKGAAMHGKAAALYAGGAVVVGGIARAFGSAGGAGGGGGAASGASLPSTTSSAINKAPEASAGKSVTVVVGDDFADDSPRKRQQRAQRMVALGLRTDSEVTYS